MIRSGVGSTNRSRVTRRSGCRCAAHRRAMPTNDPERASVTVELLVLTPVLVLLAVLIAALGHIETVRAQVAGAARAAAEAAAQAPDAVAAEAEARQAAPMSLPAGGRGCAPLRITVDTAAFAPGGTVVVHVTCIAPLAGFVVPGLAASVRVASTVTAPIDPYRVVG